MCVCRACLFDEIELLRAGPAGPEGEVLDQVRHAPLFLRLQHRSHLGGGFAAIMEAPVVVVVVVGLLTKGIPVSLPNTTHLTAKKGIVL